MIILRFFLNSMSIKYAINAPVRLLRMDSRIFIKNKTDNLNQRNEIFFELSYRKNTFIRT